jgi:hypothetical protein
MKNIFGAILLVVFFLGCGEKKEETTMPFNQEEAIAACEAIIFDFQSSLKQELMKAMADGGPENAITVCNTRAPMISDSFSNMAGFEIKRVSLKQRNTGYSPDAYETAILENFASVHDSEPQIHSELTFDSAGVKRFRYMKEIKIGELCLNCHGDPETFSEGLKTALAAHYPDDPAVGYEVGDSRGAFSLVVTFPEAKESIPILLGNASH